MDILKVIDPGDEVISPSPIYSTHIQQVIIASGKPVLVPTIEEEGFIWDIDGIKDAITSRTKAIMYTFTKTFSQNIIRRGRRFSDFLQKS